MGFRLLKRKGDLKFDVKSAVSELESYVQQFVKDGGIKWLDATVLAIIPTWSGASRATFEKLARDLGTSIPIGPIRSKKDRQSLGRSTSQGSGFFSETGKHYFVYTTQLRYLIYNEFNLATKGPPPQPFSNNVRFTPYRFQDAGDKAWAKHVTTFKFPSVWKHLS